MKQLIRLKLGVVLFLLVPVLAQGQGSCTITLADQYHALMAFYQATTVNNAQWTRATGWSTANPNVVVSVVGWEGVTTDVNGFVTSLDLHGNNLTGTIPAEIGTLCKLTSLYLYSNNLSGAIPSAIGNLSSLDRLYLDSNSLTDPVPASLGSLVNMKYLYLNANQFKGNFPSQIAGLTQLIKLNLAYNEFKGTVPDLSALTHLTDLILNNNKITGNIPAGLEHASGLLELWLSYNDFDGNIPSGLGSLTNIYYIILAGNKLEGSIPASFANIPSLLQLNVVENNLTGNIPSIQGAGSYKIHGNKFTFSNFLPALASYGGSEFLYNSQQEIDEEKTITVGIGGSLTLTTNIDRTATGSTYQWYKIVGGQPDPLQQSGHTVIINSITAEDNGTKYYYTIKNSNASGLTLTSKLQTIATTNCPVPVLDFTVAEQNSTHTFTPGLSQSGCTVTYNWNFGDGETATTGVSSHVFNTSGTYTVVLTATVQCNGCPPVTLTKEKTVTVAPAAGGLCDAIYCDGNGNVGIGTRKIQGFRLSVNGKIRANDIIKVYPSGEWSDFVFEKNYRLRPLSEVETYISVNGHLPEIPSAKEVETNGVEMGSMDAKLLQKIEELTLYMIEAEKVNKEMQKKIEALEKANALLAKKGKE